MMKKTHQAKAEINKIITTVNDVLNFECFKSSYKKFVSYNDYFNLKYIGKIETNELINKANEIVNFGASLKKIFTDNGAGDKTINPLFSSVLDIALSAADMDIDPNLSGYQQGLKTKFE